MDQVSKSIHLNVKAKVNWISLSVVINVLVNLTNQWILIDLTIEIDDGNAEIIMFFFNIGIWTVIY